MPSSRERVLTRAIAATETAEQRSSRQVAAAYNQARRELLARLLEGWTGTSVMTPEDAARLLRQSGLLQQIDARLLQLEREVGITLRGIVTDASERALEGIRREMALLPAALRPSDLDMFSTINSRMIEQFVPPAMADWHSLTTGMSNTLSRELQTGLIQGESFPSLATRLLRQAPGDGPGAVFPRAQTSADLATRRLVIAAENGAKQAAIAETAAIIPEVRKQAFAVIGENTTDCCLRVHGQIQPVDAPFELVGEPRFADRLMTSPFHWNCRTAISMYHPAFEASLPTSKMQAAAAAELRRREEEKTGRKKRDEAPRALTVAPAPQRTLPAPPAFDPDDAEQVRQRLVEQVGGYDERIMTAKEEAWRIASQAANISIDRLEKNVARRAGTPEGERLATELAKRIAERDALIARRLALQGDIDRMETERRRAVADLLHVRNPARLVANAPGVDTAMAERWKQGLGEFASLVSADVAPKDKLVSFVQTAKDRAFYNPNYQTVNLGERSNTPTVVHELGHWLEDKNPEIHRKALEFYDRRTAGESLQWLGPGYDRAEVTRKDLFLDAYMGRDYGRGATEIVSMGVEYLYEKPLEMAAKDPDYFRFMFNLLRGK